MRKLQVLFGFERSNKNQDDTETGQPGESRESNGKIIRVLNMEGFFMDKKNINFECIAGRFGHVVLSIVYS